MNVLQKEFENILNTYVSGKHYDELKLAKADFITRTGQIDEETDEYESRMNSFNDWYLFNYRKDDGSRIIDHYLKGKDAEDDFIKAINSVTYSLFLFNKINFRKQVVIKDVLHDNKFVLSKENGELALVEDDLFVGRSIDYKGEKYLLNGLCTLPIEILSTLKKESKKIRKLNNSDEEEQFLLNLERLKTKSVQYGHIDSSKIFVF